MRGAGCIVNDMLDRDIDANVERTRNRPLASGALTMQDAVKLLVLLLCAAWLVVLQLPWQAIGLSACALPLVACYPLMKRITWWPQAFLGITFNSGALIGWAAATGGLASAAFALYAGGIFWTLGYDTIYAHQDKCDDARVGVKSTALRLGKASATAIAIFYALAIACWATAGTLAAARAGYYIGISAAALHAAWQLRTVRYDDPASCGRVFRANSTLGVIMFLGALFA